MLSYRQATAIRDSNSRINIFQGPVRAGKTYSAIYRWMQFCKEGPPGAFCVVGRSQKALKRNFINPFIELVGTDFSYFEGKQEAYYGGRTMYIVGANDERATGKIQGSTFAGAWVDEATLLPESFFKMLLSRLSIDGAKLFCTTNPDSPNHWLKTQYIDNKELNLSNFEFTIDDNPSLTEQFKNDLKKEYSGLWYKRYILGEWCLAEGSVYDFFDANLHTVRQNPSWAREYYLSIDYGTNNPFAALLIAYNWDNHPAIWVEKEYYWDSSKKGIQKSPADYFRDMKKHFYDIYPISQTFLDPSALYYAVESRKGGRSIIQANNDVIPGIQCVANLLSQGDLVINRECQNLINEFHGYCWDSKSIKLGEDKPLKVNDHLLDALRYCIYTKWGSGKAVKQERKERPRNQMLDVGIGSSFGWQRI